MMKDDYFKLLRGFDDEQTDYRTEICECRVAFATENYYSDFESQKSKFTPLPLELSFQTAGRIEFSNLK